MSKLSEYFTDENVIKCAEEIVVAFETKSTQENLEVDFSINNGKMSGSLDISNTGFKFDTSEGELLHEIRSVLTQSFREESADIDKDAADILDFQTRVCEELGKDIYNKRLADVLRSEQSGLNAPEWLIPIPEICFQSFELSSDDEGGYMLRVLKGAGSTSESVAPELIEIHQETGTPFNDIIAQKKSEGDLRYEHVDAADWVRYIFDVHLDFAADYSPCEKTEDVERKIKEIMAAE